MKEKSRQTAENKQTFDLMGKIENEEKTRQSARNKQTFDLTPDGKRKEKKM